MSYWNYDERYKAIEEEVKFKRIERINARLKLCPCCGEKAKVMEGFKTDGKCGCKTIYIECSLCGLRTKDFIVEGHYDKIHAPEEAAEIWNRRYSGINDKNGKPICEGDHIRIAETNWYDYVPGEYVVCYSDTCFHWYLNKIITIDGSKYVGDHFFFF